MFLVTLGTVSHVYRVTIEPTPAILNMYIFGLFGTVYYYWFLQRRSGFESRFK